MFAPNENCSEVVGHVPDGLTVLKVGTLAEAKARLAAIASGTAASKLPQCTE
jgi:PDZ domain-containing protein